MDLAEFAGFQEVERRYLLHPERGSKAGQTNSVLRIVVSLAPLDPTVEFKPCVRGKQRLGILGMCRFDMWLIVFIWGLENPHQMPRQRTSRVLARCVAKVSICRVF